MEVTRADVEAALGRPVSTYDIEPIDPHLRIHSITGGVYRVRTDVGSCVLKVVLRSDAATPDGLWGGDDDVGGRNYWKREWLAFATGLLDNLPGRLRAPTTISAVERSADECWIWMAEVAGRTGAALTLDDYRTIGFALGTTQGAFVTGATPLPDDDWLSRRWLRGWLGACAGMLAHLDDAPEPVRPIVDRVLALWERREDLLRIVETAPQTLVHCDFWPMNLIVDDDACAIDWSQVGIGAVAQDIDQMTLDPVWMQVRPGQRIEDLEELVVPAYVDGLRAAGCRIDPDEVWRWYAAAGSAHCAWLAGAVARALRDPEEAARLERRWDRPIAAISEDRLAVVRRAVELGERALGSTA